MRVLAGVVLAGGLGALARYGLDGFISSRTPSAFPWGILVVNISGSFVLGLIFTVMTNRFAGSSDLRVWITTGFLGAYTTFSTLTLESVRLLQDRAYLLAAANSVGSLGLGLLAAAAGIALGSAV